MKNEKTIRRGRLYGTPKARIGMGNAFSVQMLSEAGVVVDLTMSLADARRFFEHALAKLDEAQGPEVDGLEEIFGEEIRKPPAATDDESSVPVVST